MYCVFSVICAVLPGLSQTILVVIHLVLSFFASFINVTDTAWDQLVREVSTHQRLII